MNPVTLDPTTSTAENTDPKRESDPSQFRAALQQQSVALLETLLDPAQSASLPGAASALAEAVSAEQDVSVQASEQLAQRESRQGARERGLDASSQARQELSREGGSPASGSEASPKPQAHTSAQDSQSAPAHNPSPEREATGTAPDRADTSSTNRSVQAEGPQTGNKAMAPDDVEPARTDARRGESAFAAVSRMSQVATSAQAASTATSSGVSATASAAKVTAPAGVGEIADQRANPAKVSKQVIRQEPRTFEAQLQRGLAQVLRQKGGTLSMKLTPNELGEVKVSLTIAKGHVEGSIEASNESARGLLEQNIEKLKSSLEQRGITVDRLEVRLAGAGSIERQDAQGQEARADLNQQNADAGGDRQPGSAPGEDRQQGTPGRTPSTPDTTDLRGAESGADDEAAHGSAAEPLGRWLRLDTLA